MKAHFSIEWMAQSSQQHRASSGTQEDLPPPGSVNKAFTAGPHHASGTHPASLPGSYCRQGDQEESPKEDGGHRHPGSKLTSPHQHHAHNLHSQQMAETGFSSGTEEETSGYDSEGSRSLSPITAFNADLSPSSSSSDSPSLGRRPRTAFTAEQISSLERAFKRNAYLGTQDKAELCSKLSLSDKQVRNWFQNRRMKLKRTVQDALAHACQANMASQLLHYPELQHAAYRPGPYTPRYHPAAAAHYGSHGAAASPMTLDAFYHYAGLPGVLLAPGSPQMMAYQPLPQQY